MKLKLINYATGATCAVIASYHRLGLDGYYELSLGQVKRAEKLLGCGLDELGSRNPEFVKQPCGTAALVARRGASLDGFYRVSWARIGYMDNAHADEPGDRKYYAQTRNQATGLWENLHRDVTEEDYEEAERRLRNPSDRNPGIITHAGVSFDEARSSAMPATTNSMNSTPESTSAEPTPEARLKELEMRIVELYDIMAPGDYFTTINFKLARIAEVLQENA